MYEKLYMSAKFWHHDVRVSHLQKSTRTFVFEKAKTWTSPDTASYLGLWNVAH